MTRTRYRTHRILAVKPNQCTKVVCTDCGEYWYVQDGSDLPRCPCWDADKEYPWPGPANYQFDVLRLELGDRFGICHICRATTLWTDHDKKAHIDWHARQVTKP